ncbi:MAG: sulfatase-like hydrolase/transferase [Hyphomicrobiales bacterium]
MKTERPHLNLVKFPESDRRIAVRTGLKLLLLAAFVVLTNVGFGQRAAMLYEVGRWETLIPYLLIWGLALVAIAVAAFHPNTWVRLFWAAVMTVSSAVAWGYHHASQSEFTVFDIVSLWNARHEAGRAADFYGHDIALGAVVLVSGFLIMALPAGTMGPLRRWVGRLGLLPVLPIAAIAAIVFMKGGGGSQAMPAQFTPVALSSLAGAKIALQGAPVRQPVTWQPASGPKRNIVMLIDESIRYEYLDFAPGNPHTPRLAGLKDRFVNFGPAVSGGNCSNYSNAILRFGASRKDVTGSINSNPTIWSFAKKAGYRTVYIDAQAGGITNPGLMQNYMTMTERQDIDSFHALRDVSSAEADFKLSQIVADELAKPGPVFIYANKNGAHFPYDAAYPAVEAHYHPTMTEAGTEDPVGRIASYRNAIAWSVDKFMADFLGRADLANTTLVYTSDHGQNLDPGKLTHCVVDNPDERTAMVPLLVATDDAALRAELAAAAQTRRGLASHFQIVPSVLSWMGYGAADIATVYDESLTSGTRVPAFTSGDVFGLFSSDVHWTPVDSTVDRLEGAGRKLLPQSPVGAGS